MYPELGLGARFEILAVAFFAVEYFVLLNKQGLQGLGRHPVLNVADLFAWIPSALIL